MPNYLRLQVWQLAHRLARDLYRATTHFPVAERYRLQTQLLKAAVSIPANVAEGSRRGSDADFARMLRIALGSASELDYYLLLASELGYVEQGKMRALRKRLDRIMRMLQGLINKLQARSP